MKGRLQFTFMPGLGVLIAIFLIDYYCNPDSQMSLGASIMFFVMVASAIVQLNAHFGKFQMGEEDE